MKVPAQVTPGAELKRSRICLMMSIVLLCMGLHEGKPPRSNFLAVNPNGDNTAELDAAEVHRHSVRRDRNSRVEDGPVKVENWGDVGSQVVSDRVTANGISLSLGDGEEFPASDRREVSHNPNLPLSGGLRPVHLGSRGSSPVQRKATIFRGCACDIAVQQELIVFDRDGLACDRAGNPEVCVVCIG